MRSKYALAALLRLVSFQSNQVSLVEMGLVGQLASLVRFLFAVDPNLSAGRALEMVMVALDSELGCYTSTFHAHLFTPVCIRHYQFG